MSMVYIPIRCYGFPIQGFWGGKKSLRKENEWISGRCINCFSIFLLGSMVYSLGGDMLSREFLYLYRSRIDDFALFALVFSSWNGTGHDLQLGRCVESVLSPAPD